MNEKKDINENPLKYKNKGHINKVNHYDTRLVEHNLGFRHLETDAKKRDWLKDWPLVKNLHF